MEQPVPTVTVEDVGRLAAREFPDDVEAVLQTISEHEPRVQAAILKLSEGNREALRRYSSEAVIDYRDVLAPAEYPEYSALPVPQRSSQDDSVIDRDWDQYVRWFEGGK